MSETIYTPPPTVAEMLECTARLMLIMGPVGSGKSTGSIMKLVKFAFEQKPGPDGKRRTRWAVIRNTWPMLRDTTLNTFNQWFPPGLAGDWKEGAKVFTLRVGDVEAEFLFRPLDTPDDVRKLLSLEITGAFINEAREIPREIVEGVMSRCGRYPATKDGGATWSGLVCDTNPPDIDTYWHDVAEGKINGWKVFKQPSGMSPKAENKENLPPRYYENLIETNSPGWVDVYVHGRYGLGNAGKPVFPDFRRDLHVASIPLNIPAGARDIYMGMDFGLNPSVVMGAFDAFGRLIVFDEVFADGMGADRFTEMKLRPRMSRWGINENHTIYGDPAGTGRAQTDEKSCFDILRGHQLKAKPTGTNTLVERLGAVEDMLTSLIDGKGKVIISPVCARLITALSGGYRYKKTKGLEDEPEKNEFSHIADAFQYLCVGTGTARRRDDRQKRRSSYKPYRVADTHAGY